MRDNSIKTTIITILGILNMRDNLIKTTIITISVTLLLRYFGVFDENNNYSLFALGYFFGMLLGSGLASFIINVLKNRNSELTKHSENEIT